MHQIDLDRSQYRHIGKRLNRHPLDHRGWMIAATATPGWAVLVLGRLWVGRMDSPLPGPWWLWLIIGLAPAVSFGIALIAQDQ